MIKIQVCLKTQILNQFHLIKLLIKLNIVRKIYQMLKLKKKIGTY